MNPAGEGWLAPIAFFGYESSSDVELGLTKKQEIISCVTFEDFLGKETAMATPDPLSPLRESLSTIQARLNGTEQKLAALENTVSSTSKETLLQCSSIMKSALEILIKIENQKQESAKTDKPEAEKHDTIWEFFKTLAGTVVIFAIPVYAAGWGFLYRYYKGFGLSISDLDIPLYETLIYSFRPFFDKPTWTVCALAVVFVIGLILNLSSVKRLRRSPLREAVLLVLFVVSTYGLFRWGTWVGRERANQDMMVDSSTLPFVAILVNAEAFQRDEQDYLKFDKTEFKLLLHANKQYFFFRPLKRSGSTSTLSNIQNIEVYVIPDDKIRVVRVQRGV